MLKTPTLVWQFYKPLIAFNLVITVVCINSLLKIGFWFIGFTLFIKLVGYLATIGYKQYFASKTNLYFLNAGQSIKKMYLLTFAIDILLYLLIFTCLYSAKWILPL